MKNGDLKQIFDRFDRLEGKMDKVLDEKIPQMERDIAVMKTKSGLIATGITLVGGALAVGFSWLKK